MVSILVVPETVAMVAFVSPRAGLFGQLKAAVQPLSVVPLFCHCSIFVMAMASRSRADCK